MSSSSFENKDLSYTIDVSAENLIISDSLRSSLSDKYLNEAAPSELSKPQVRMLTKNREFVGDLSSFEIHSDYTVINFIMRENEALHLMKGERFDAIKVSNDEDLLWSDRDLPKLKDSVVVTLSPEGAHVSLTLRKITRPLRHK